eukprot:4914721-Amphidinium_carterae.2
MEHAYDLLVQAMRIVIVLQGVIKPSKHSRCICKCCKVFGLCAGKHAVVLVKSGGLRKRTQRPSLDLTTVV